MTWTKDLSDHAISELGMRPIVPYGLPLSLGDVVEVHDDWTVDLVGRIETLALVAPGPDVQGPSTAEWSYQSSSGVSVSFKAQGQTSELVQDVGNAQARLEVSFDDSDSVLVAARGIAVKTLRDLASLGPALLAAYSRGVWKKSYALVTAIGSPEHYSLIASSSSKAAIALNTSADIGPSASIGDVSVAVGVSAQRGALVRFVNEQNAVAFWRGVRVKDSFFGGAHTAPAAVEDVEFFDEV